MFNFQRVKPIKDIIAGSPKLARKLKLMDIIFIGLGATIGAGIFVVIGTASSNYAGPAISLSFVLSACVLSIVAFCYAELSSRIPASGGPYSYAYASFGEFPAWLVSSIFFLTYLVCTSSVAVGFSSYLVSFLEDYNIHIPPEYTRAYGVAIEGSDAVGILNVPAICGVIMATWVMIQDVKFFAMLNNAAVVLKIGVLALFIIFGALYIDPTLWSPFIPENKGVFGQFGYSGIVGGAAASIFAFIGFESIASATQEAIKPKRDVPLGIVLTLLLSSTTYAIVGLVVTGLVHYKELDVSYPMALAMDAIHNPTVSFLVVLGIVIGLLSVLLGLMYSLTRTSLTVIQDGLLPQYFGHIDPKTKSPKRLTILVASIMILAILFLPIDTLVSLSNLSVLSTFLIVCVINVYMRYAHKVDKGDTNVFLCPGMPFLPVIAVISLGTIISTLEGFIFLYTLYYLLFMSVVYLVYGKNNSTMA